MVSNVLILAARQMDFEAERDGKKEQVRGARVHYVMSDLGADGGHGEQQGFLPYSVWLNGRAAQNLDAVPGLYEGGFQLVKGEKGPELKLTSVSQIRPVDLSFEASPTPVGNTK